MTSMAEHAKKQKRRTEGLVAAWLGLITAGFTTVTFNVWHATHSGMVTGLGIIEGIAPVALAMIVSHLVATYNGDGLLGYVLRGGTFAVMIGAMILSVGATGAVVHPAARALWWLFGAVVDAAALACLQVLLSLRERAAREERERAGAEALAADERTGLRAEVGTLRDELAARDEAAKAALESLRAQLETAHADLAEALTRKEELAARIAQMTAQKKRAKAAGGSAQAEDLTTEFRALDEMEKDPSLRGPRMGGELARRIGVSGATGRRLHARLTAHGQSAGSPGERSPDAADERSPAEEG